MLRHLSARLALFVTLTAGALAGCAPANVHVAGPNAEQHQIVVQGEGEAAAAPDLARVSLGIEVLSPNVGAATKQANERMTAIMAAIKQQGVADKDMRTSQLSVHFERQYEQPPYYPSPIPYAPTAAPAAPPPPAAPAGVSKGGKATAAAATATATPASPPAMTLPPPVPAGPAGFYRVTHSLDVSVRDMGRLGPIVDVAMAAGANSLNGVSFTIEKNEPVLARARETAMKDARQRAEALARLGGVTLGDLVSIQEEPGGGGGMYMMPMAKAVDASATPIAAGEVNLQMRVRVVYALK
jgi:uncharacterized protein YggE